MIELNFKYPLNDDIGNANELDEFLCDMGYYFNISNIENSDFYTTYKWIHSANDDMLVVYCRSPALASYLKLTFSDKLINEVKHVEFHY